MNPWLLGLLSGGSSLLGGLLNRQRDPMQDFLRTSFLTLGTNNPLDFANSAYARWLGSPAYAGIQNALFGQQTGFQNRLQGSLANRGLLNSGIGNLIGSLGSSLYGGNLAQLQGQQYSSFADLFPQLLNQRMALSGLGSRPSVAQGIGAGLQGLGNFGLNFMALGGGLGGGGQAGGPAMRMGMPGFQYPLGGQTPPFVGPNPYQFTGQQGPPIPQRRF